jgi:hypothetical protein
MVCAAQIMRNANNWVTPSNSDRRNVAVPVNLPNGINYLYGHEEWLFHNEMKKRNIGYLECYRKHSYQNCDTIILFAKGINNNHIFHVGTLYGVTQLQDNNISDIKKSLGTPWLNKVQKNLDLLIGNTPNGNVPSSLYQHWNSNTILKDDLNNQPGFAFNIKYKRYEILVNPINLTLMDSSININWKRLSTRYYLDNMIKTLPKNNPLKNYLNNLLP